MDPSNADTDEPDDGSISVPLPQAYTLLTSFTSFLTVAIHNILFYRGIYPERTFISARAFSLPVHQNRHPAVCAWVCDAVDAVLAQVADGAVDRIAVVIHAPAARPPPPGRPGQVGASNALKPPAAAATMGPPPRPTKKPAASSAAAAVPPRPPSQPPPPPTTTTTRAPPPKPGAVLERWMFDVSAFPAWPGGAEALASFGNEEVHKKKTKKKPEEQEPPQGEGAEGDEDSDDDSESAEEAVDLSSAEEDENADDDDYGGSDPDEDRDAHQSVEVDIPEEEINWADVNENLRGAVKRLAHAGEQLDRLPEGCTFTVAVELKDAARPPTKHPQAWIPSQANLQRPSRKAPRSGQDIGGARTTAIRSVDAGPLFFECWVEEGKAKIFGTS